MTIQLWAVSLVALSMIVQVYSRASGIVRPLGSLKYLAALLSTVNSVNKGTKGTLAAAINFGVTVWCQITATCAIKTLN